MACLELKRWPRLTYRRCEDYLSGKISLRLAPNTLLYKGIEEREDYYFVRFWSTDIIKFYKDGRVIINARGHMTMTTKERLNALACEVYQYKWNWYADSREYYHNMNVGAPQTPEESEQMALERLKAAAAHGDKFAKMQLADIERDQGVRKQDDKKC